MEWNMKFGGDLEYPKTLTAEYNYLIGVLTPPQIHFYKISLKPIL